MRTLGSPSRAETGAFTVTFGLKLMPELCRYPTYWHARGYGLFAANPFGVKDFTEGKEELNYKIPAGESLKMRYRIIVTSGKHLSDAEINAFAEDFATKYK